MKRKKIVLAVTIIINLLVTKTASAIPFHAHGDKATTWERDGKKGTFNFHPNNPMQGVGKVKDLQAGNSPHQHFDDIQLNITQGNQIEPPYSVQFAWDNRDYYNLGIRLGAGNPVPILPHGFIDSTYESNIPRYSFVGDIWSTDPKAKQAQPIIINAFKQWSDISAALSPVSGLPLIMGLDFLMAQPDEPAEISILWENLPGSALGLHKTFTSNRPGTQPGIVRLINSVTFNSTKDWFFGLAADTPEGKFHFRSVALHEVGHVVGLGHIGNVKSVMFSLLDQGITNPLDSIDLDSKNAAIALYSIPLIPNPNGTQGANRTGEKNSPQIKFDAETKKLSFTDSLIDFANLAGNESLDPRFIDDPILGATVQITDMTLSADLGDGFIFTGGRLNILNNGETLLTADIPSLLIDDTSSTDFGFNIFGVLDITSLQTSSPFLLSYSEFLENNPLFPAELFGKTPEPIGQLIASGESFTTTVKGFSLSASTQPDWGDAPDSYRTLLLSNGPFYLNPGGSLERLGTEVDGEVNGQPTLLADGDDISLLGGVPSPVDDEDGVFFGDSFVDVTFNIARPGENIYQLRAWWDIDRDMCFDHLTHIDIGCQNNELFIDDLLTLTPSIFTKRYSLPFNPKADGLYSRFRLTWDPEALDIKPFGAAPSKDGYTHGEVEDYVEVPEPSSIVGIFAVGGLGLMGLRKKQ